MSSPATRSCLTAADGYRLWASTYDRDPNPMLALERRILEPLLPPLAGLDVVDLGCGSGRWLAALKESGARSLLGVDFSPEMLSLANSKLDGQASILCADFANVPLAAASADLLLCNFVLSYIEDAESFLGKASRVLRPGGSLFLTDIHPETAAALNWKRGVRSQQDFHEIRTHERTIGEVISLCEKFDLSVAILLEPPFGEEERIILENNGKGEYFHTIAERPSIYILQVCAPNTSSDFTAREDTPTSLQLLRGARFALGPNTSVCGEMRFTNGRIHSFYEESRGSNSSTSLDESLDLRGYLVLPGLVNAHDHLEFALFPRLGKGGYKNFMEWADDIHYAHAQSIAMYRRVPREARLGWGGIRNLLSGVTTVCHHNPFEPEAFTDDFVVRVLRNFGWAHSLPLDPAAAKKKKETPHGHPFFIHLGEGVDEKSEEEIFELDAAGALDADTVIIHGLALGSTGRDLLRSAGAGLVWCPSSNLFLFGKTLPWEEIRRYPKVALGSDSPLTAAGDLLDEVRCARGTSQIPAAEIYGSVTEQAAVLLGLRDGEGKVRIGGRADLIAVRDRALSPAETLATLSYRDVELVLLGGCVQLSSAEFMTRLPASATAGLQPLWIEGVVRWIRARVDWLFEETYAHIPEPLYLGGKQVRLGS